MAELIPLAIASAFWPTLLAVAIISLAAPHPGRLLASFLAGGLLATISVGLAVIYVLQGTSAVSTSKRTTDAAVAITAGVLALVAAFVLQRRVTAPGPPEPKPESDTGEDGRMKRMLDRGAPIAFVAGIVLDLFPGVIPLVALTKIAELDYSVPETILVLLGFYLIMFAFIEIPLIGYLVAPDRAADLTGRFLAWLRRNAQRLAVWALTLIGVYLIVRGIISATD
jgi:hypothetical protein